MVMGKLDILSKRMELDPSLKSYAKINLKMY